MVVLIECQICSLDGYALGLQDADSRSMWTLTWSKAHTISSGLNPGLLSASGLGPPVPPPESPKPTPESPKESHPPQASLDPSAQPPPPGPSQQPEDSTPSRQQDEEASQHAGPSENAQQPPGAAASQARSAALQETLPPSAEASGAQGLPVQQQSQRASMPQAEQQQQQSHTVPDAEPQSVPGSEPSASGEAGSFSQPPCLPGGTAAQPQSWDGSDGRGLAEPRQAAAGGAGLQPQQSMTVQGSLASAAGGSGQYAEVSGLARGLWLMVPRAMATAPLGLLTSGPGVLCCHGTTAVPWRTLVSCAASRSSM